MDERERRLISATEDHITKNLCLRDKAMSILARAEDHLHSLGQVNSERTQKNDAFIRYLHRMLWLQNKIVELNSSLDDDRDTLRAFGSAPDKRLEKLDELQDAAQIAYNILLDNTLALN